MSWTPTLIDRAGPLYRRIVEALADDIACGRLHRGQQLPTHRALAASLGIDLTTVTRAYGEARRQGLIQARVGLGSFVADDRVAMSNRSSAAVLYDLSMVTPPMSPEADLDGRIARGMAAIYKETGYAHLLAYRDFDDRVAERAIAAAWLARRIPKASADRLVTHPGAQNALFCLLFALAAPGEIILVERHTYPGILAAAAARQITPIGIESDADGILPAALEEACQRHGAKLVYLNPTIQNPTTATLPERRRDEIIEIIRRFDLLLIEDDAYGQLVPEVAPLAARMPERTFHVASLSKCVSPGLRTAFMLAPQASSAERVADALRASVQMPNMLTAALAARWLRDGSADAIIAAVRAEAAARQKLAAAILGNHRYAAHPNGHHLWLPLGSAWTPGEYAAYLKQKGLAVDSADVFQAGGEPLAAIRVSLGAAPDRPRLVRALEILEVTLSAMPVNPKEKSHSPQAAPARGPAD